MNYEKLVRYWERQQGALQAIIQEHCPDNNRYQLRLDQHKFFFLSPEGEECLVADCRFILSYALSNRSILMGWANHSLESHMCVPPIDGLPDSAEDCDQEDAWELAMRAGYAAGAEYLYRAPSAQSVGFLALWKVRPPTKDERVETGAPNEWVLSVLRSLEAALGSRRELGDLSALLQNYGAWMCEQAREVYGKTAWRERLEATGTELQKLSEGLAGRGRSKVARALAEAARGWL